MQRKPSNLRPPSRIARPTSSSTDKKEPEIDDGSHSRVKRLSGEMPNVKFAESEIFGVENRKLGEDSGRRSSDGSMTLTEDTDSFIVGDRVWVGGTRAGVIAYIGETQFGPGDWAGVVLDEPIGKNDGSVAGVRYFQCAPNRGIFSRLTRLSRTPLDANQNISRSNGSPPSIPEDSVLSSNSFRSSSPLKPPPDLKIDERVIVKSSHGSKAGVLRYYGTTEFANGYWCGVELDDPLGKNDGTVNGIRYFDCAPKFGLFVPAEKVSRSPISSKKSPSCAVHPSGMSRQGSQDSFRSISSIATTTASSMRSGARRYGTLQSVSSPKSPLQHAEMKEKDMYIQQLLKEKELERRQVTRAATLVEEAEKRLASVRADYDKVHSEKELLNVAFNSAIGKLEKEKAELKQMLDEEKKKVEDYQFNYEEESLSKSEIQTLNEQYKKKIEELEGTIFKDGTSKVDDAMERCETTSSVDVNRLDEIKCLKEEVEHYKHHKEINEKNLKYLQMKITNIQNILNIREQKLEQTLVSNKKMEQRLEEADAAVLRLRNEINVYKHKIKELSNNVEPENQNLDTNQVLLGILKQLCDTISSKMRDKIPYCLEVTDDTTDIELKPVLTLLATLIDGAVNYVAELEEKCVTLSEVINKKDEEIVVLNEEKSNLRSEYDNYVEVTNSKIKHLESDYILLVQAKEDLEIQLKNSKENTKRLESLFESKDETSKLEVENVKSILEEKIKEYEKLSSEFSDKINHLTDEIFRKDEETAVSLAKQENIIKELNADFECTKTQMESLVQSRNEVQEEFDEYKTIKQLEIVGLKETISEQHKKITELEEFIFNEKSVIDNLKEKILDLSSKIADSEKKDIIDSRLDPKIVRDVFQKMTESLSEIYNSIQEMDNEKLVAKGANFGDLPPDLRDPVVDVVTNFKKTATNLVLQMKKMKSDYEDLRNDLQTKEDVISVLEHQIQLLSTKSAQEEAESECESIEREPHNSSQIDVADSKILEEKQQFEQQINFLNSVIVDMQHKNEGLLERMQYLESARTYPTTEEYHKQKLPTPRMFCDICDMFDQHETENCTQRSEGSPVPLKKHKQKPPERPYCLSCEVFGHDTSQCNDQQTF